MVLSILERMTGLDPELSNAGYGGIDNNFYPRPRTYMIGLNLKF